MELEATTQTVVTQVSFGGFDSEVLAKDLVDYLDENIGLVYRCRLKTSWTPPEAYPDFNIVNTSEIEVTEEYKKIEPHAFVHFASPKSATFAFNAAGSCELFIKQRALKVSLGPENPFCLSQRRRKAVPYRLADVVVEVGNFVSRDDFLVAWRGPAYGVDFLVDPFDGTCKISFTKDTAFSFKGTNKKAVIKCNFKVEFLVRDINEIRQYNDISYQVILLNLASSPKVWYRTADDDIENLVPFDLLDDDDPWIRTTDCTPSGAIGRCNSYKLSVPPRNGAKLCKAMTYLKERRVQMYTSHPVKVHNEPDFGRPMLDPFFSVDMEAIGFEIMYMVNAVIHKGIFNQHQLSDNFFCLLKHQPKEVSVAALKHICSYRHPVYDATKRLRVVQEWLMRNPKLIKSCRDSDHIAEVRRLIITPAKAYCVSPEVELSNRVLREYKEVSDRFLRVTFMDEGMQTLNSGVLSYYVAPIVKEITSNRFLQRTNVFKRVKTILEKGFKLCGRRYSFLAFSSNQLRDRSAWFFAEDKNLTCNRIRSWMGKFHNKNVAKCAARMGQCFSSTYATIEVPSIQVNPKLPDIKRNNYTFSDGIGTITPDLANEVAEKLNLESISPCAYQIRYAGCKGVVACWPTRTNGIRLCLRPSMNKFHSLHTNLEICSWTRFQPGFLNRQIVTLLSTLNVPDEVFWDMQEEMVSKLDCMLTDVEVAFDILTTSCADQGNAAAIMLSAGFHPGSEPHLRGLLTSIRAAQFWGLREKARIFVSSGRWLMGVLDELGVLEHGQCFIQVSTPSLENCFLKHGSKFAETKKNLQVVKGFVVVAKNPCLHPGDVRILEAVDAPGLHHLYDCLVFPQKGDRPHTDEASGSDLDGDLYFVTWDQNLVPPSKKSWKPMEYTPTEPKLNARDITPRDLIDFFVKNMVNEQLGPICNAHVVHADTSKVGALDEDCLVLAELAATAVDFPKTGKIVTMPPHLRPKMYPDFMGKEEGLSYKSTKILGRLYRRVKDSYDEDEDAKSTEISFPDIIPYDSNLEVSGSADFIVEAWGHKCSYDSQLNGLLSQYKVQREEELVTGHIWSMPKYNSRKQGELKEKLKHSYNALKKEFRDTFENMNSDIDGHGLNEDEKGLLYEKKASAWYKVTYHPDWVKKSKELQDPENTTKPVMLSFPWIAADYLARIKIRHRSHATVDSTKPINTLVQYVADRI